MPQPDFAEKLAQFSPDSIWPAPGGDWYRVGDARKTLREKLTEACVKVVEEEWGSELPAAQWPRARKQVQTGVREAIRMLIPQNTKDPRVSWAWSEISQDRIAHYWEPAIVPEQGLTLTQQTAVRWASALVNLYVRNALEGLHAMHTSDDSMPALNRRIRNEVAAIACSDSWLLYHFAQLPACAIWCVQHGLMPTTRVPRAAGKLPPLSASS